jgi:hypothetical protein
MAKKTAHSPLPDGIGAEHIDLRPKQRRPGILSLVILGALVAIGLSGYAGGGSAQHEVRNAAGLFVVRAPDTIRNGEIFETRLRVVARRPIGKLVIGVDPAFWRELTTNSTVPQAGEETFRDGLFRFSFDKVEAGAAFEFQVAQQINPGLWGTNRGRVVFLDGDTVLAELPVALRVLP